jgi:hypothetical protein
MASILKPIKIEKILNQKEFKKIDVNVYPNSYWGNKEFILEYNINARNLISGNLIHNFKQINKINSIIKESLALSTNETANHYSFFNRRIIKTDLNYFYLFNSDLEENSKEINDEFLSKLNNSENLKQIGILNVKNYYMSLFSEVKEHLIQIKMNLNSKKQLEREDLEKIRIEAEKIFKEIEEKLVEHVKNKIMFLIQEMNDIILEEKELGTIYLKLDKDINTQDLNKYIAYKFFFKESEKILFKKLSKEDKNNLSIKFRIEKIFSEEEIKQKIKEKNVEKEIEKIESIFITKINNLIYLANHQTGTLQIGKSQEINGYCETIKQQGIICSTFPIIYCLITEEN